MATGAQADSHSARGAEDTIKPRVLKLQDVRSGEEGAQALSSPLRKPVPAHHGLVAELSPNDERIERLQLRSQLDDEVPKPCVRHIPYQVSRLPSDRPHLEGVSPNRHACESERSL